MKEMERERERREKESNRNKCELYDTLTQTDIQTYIYPDRHAHTAGG